MVATTEPTPAETPVQTVEQTTEPSVIEDDFLKAQKLFQQGKKNLLLSKYDEAASNIADACKAYSAKYGELDYNCADVYFYYGKALFELARVENTVLGNALSGVPEDTEPINDSRYGNPDTVPEEEREEIFDKVIDAMCEETKEEKKEEPMSTDAVEGEKKEETAPVDKVEVTTEKKEEPVAAEPMSTEVVEKKEEVKEEEKKVEEGPKEESAEKKESVEGDVVEKKEENGEAEEEAECDEDEGEDVEEGEKTNKDEEEEEDITNLQQAWEMYELSKVIYLKQKELATSDEEKLKIRMRIAECMLKLGEIGIEQELFEQAINDIKEAIRIQEEEVKVEERDERLLAECYYQLALSYQFNNQFDVAKESHNKATNILHLRIDKLKSKLAASDATGTVLEESDKKLITDEITELEQLLPEMILKLEELNDQGEKVINEVRECLNGNGFDKASSASATAATTDVKDITGSIKSKRRLSASNDDQAENNDASDKKTKLEESEEKQQN